MGLLENALSLRTSAHAGVAIPRIFKHLGRKTKLFPSNRGAATPVTSVTGSQRHTFLTAPFQTVEKPLTGFSDKFLQSAARIICAPAAHKFVLRRAKSRLRRLRSAQRCGARLRSLRSIFCQVHAPTENDFILFGGPRRQTLRGFFDELKGTALFCGAVPCVSTGFRNWLSTFRLPDRQRRLRRHRQRGRAYPQPGSRWSARRRRWKRRSPGWNG